MNLLQNMVHLYPLQKTLCFELCPVGRTKKNFDDKSQDFEDSILTSLSFDNFCKDKIVEEANNRIYEYKKIRALIDSVHSEIIEGNLRRLSSDSEFIKLLGFYKLFKVDEDYQNNLKYDSLNEQTQQEIQENRENQKDIIHRLKEFLTDNDQFQQIFSYEKLDFLRKFYKDDLKKVELLLHYTDFLSYFNRYDNRLKNIYESEEKISAIYKSIPYRLITENLPIFYVNTLKFKDIAKHIKNVLIDENIKSIDKFSLYLTTSSIKKYNKEIDIINQEITNYNSQNSYKLPHLGKLPILADLDQDFDLFRIIYDDRNLVEIINEFINRVKLQNKEDIDGFKNIFENLDKKYDTNILYIKNDNNVKSIFIDEIKELLKEEYNIDENKNEILKKVAFGNLEGSYVSFKYIEDRIAIISKNDTEEDKAIKNEIKSKIFVAISNRANKLFDIYLEKYNNAKDILDGDYNLGMKVLGTKDVNIAKIKELLDSIKEISDFVSYFVPKNPENKDLLDFYKVNFDIYNKINIEKLEKISKLYSHVKAYFTLKNFSTQKIRLNFGLESFLDSWDIDKLDENLGTILLKEEAGQIKYFLGIVNRYNFSKFEYVYDTKNVYRQMIYKNEDRKRKIEFRDISEYCIDKMVERDELYLFQIYRKDFSIYSNGNLKLHTMYWNNIFDKDNLEYENVFSIAGGARIFYRPKSLERKITHKANEPINNKNLNNSKKESNFKFDLLKDKRYTENKLMFQVPITINCNADDIELKDFNTIINKRIKEIQEKSKKDINQEGINIIALTRSENELLYYVVVNSKGDLIEQGSLSVIKTKVHNDDNNIFVTDYKKQLSLREYEYIKANKENNIGKEWKSEKGIKDFIGGYISQAVNEIIKLVKKYKAIVVFEDLDSKSEKINSIIDKPLYYKLEKALISKLSYLADKHIEDKLISKLREGSTFCGYQLAYEEEKIPDGKQNGIVFYVPTTFTTNIDPLTGFINCFSNKISSDVVVIKDFLSRFESIKYNEDKNYYEFLFSYDKFLIGNDSKTFSEEFKYLNKLYEYACIEKNWIICSYGYRMERKRRYDKNIGNNIYRYYKVNLTKEFQDLFKKYNINQDKNLKSNILNFLELPDIFFRAKKDFCKAFIRLFKLLLQMKNSDGDITYVISPVEKNGVFYDSRKFTEFSCEQQNGSFVSNLDEANCRAYNIARKGLLLLDKIEKASNLDCIDLTLNDEDWINYVDNRPIGSF